MSEPEADAEELETWEVSVVGFEERSVSASTWREAMRKAKADVDFGDLATDMDEYRAVRVGSDDERRYDVYKNGELVEMDKHLTDAEANRLDGHTQFDEEGRDFERFRVEEASADE